MIRSKCLDVCAFDPNRVIWPEGIWHMKVTKEDVPQVDSYLTLVQADKAKESASAGAALE